MDEFDSYFFLTPEVEGPRCSRRKETPAVVPRAVVFVYASRLKSGLE